MCLALELSCGSWLLENSILYILENFLCTLVSILILLICWVYFIVNAKVQLTLWHSLVTMSIGRTPNIVQANPLLAHVQVLLKNHFSICKNTFSICSFFILFVNQILSGQRSLVAIGSAAAASEQRFFGDTKRVFYSRQRIQKFFHKNLHSPTKASRVCHAV